MSHELRTPLTSILGFTEILIDQEKLTETQQRFCQRIQNSGIQLLTSLNQLVDLSRLEVGASEVFPQEFSLRETLRESCAAVARLAQKQDVTLEYDVAPELTTIVSDQGRLRPRRSRRDRRDARPRLVHRRRHLGGQHRRGQQ